MWTFDAPKVSNVALEKRRVVCAQHVPDSASLRAHAESYVAAEAKRRQKVYHRFKWK